MMSLKTKRKIAIVIFCITILALLWIFSNSMFSKEASNAQSTKVAEFLKPIYEKILPLFGKEATAANLNHYVRKTAHFAEYALLGFLLYGSLRLYHFKKKHIPLLSFPICVLCAGIDETIQYFMPDRGPMFKDVVLDSCGALAGILVCMAVYGIAKAIFVKKTSQKQS